jgi:hypothetical protein
MVVPYMFAARQISAPFEISQTPVVIFSRKEQTSHQHNQSALLLSKQININHRKLRNRLLNAERTKTHVLEFFHVSAVS